MSQSKFLMLMGLFCFSQMESDIAFFAKALNEAPIARYFTRAADLRRRAFEAILWNESRGQWLDYWLPLQKPSTKVRKVIFLHFFCGATTLTN
jgi:neutral trehalase